MVQIIAHPTHLKQQEVKISELIESYNNNPDLYRLIDTRNLYSVSIALINNIDIFLDSSFWKNNCVNTLYPYENILLLSIIHKSDNKLEYLLNNFIFRKKIYLILERDYNSLFNILINCQEHILLRFIKYMKIESPHFKTFVNKFIKEYSIIRRGYSQIYEVVFYNIKDYIIPYSDKVRAQVKKDNWRRIWWVYIILRIRMKEFIWRYYAAPYGKGYLKALNSWNKKIHMGSPVLL